MTSNVNSAVVQIEDVELQTIENDIEELESIFGDLGLGSPSDDEAESSSELDALDQALAGTEFETSDLTESGSVGSSNFFEMADTIESDDADLQEGWRDRLDPRRVAQRLAKSKAKKWIGIIVRLIRRHRGCARCAPAVARAVSAFSQKRYGTAVRHAFSAYRCIKKCRK